MAPKKQTAEQKPMKQTNPLKEADTLRRKLEKIDARETLARSNMEQRYQEERNELMEGASPTVLRLLEAAKSEVAP